MPAQYCRMKSRDDMRAVIEDLQQEHGLLAAFLEAANKIDPRALDRRVAIGEITKPINVEAYRASAAPVSSRVAPPSRAAASTLIFQRANLVRASE
jgi:hypothetical protein